MALPAVGQSQYYQNAINQLNEIQRWGQYSNRPKIVIPRGSAGTSNSPNGAPSVGGMFGKFLKAIAAQESGGNYRARSSAGALGKYQIMPGNIPSWSQRAIGRRVSPNQFFNSPDLQEQIAQYMLRSYYNKYGAKRAAEAWYGGEGAIGRGYVQGYSRSILRRMGLL